MRPDHPKSSTTLVEFIAGDRAKTTSWKYLNFSMFFASNAYVFWVPLMNMRHCLTITLGLSLWTFSQMALALDEPACPPELAKVGALLTHKGKLRMAEVNLFQRGPLHRLYGTPYLRFYLDEISPVFHLKPGKQLKIETRLESRDGQIQEIIVTLREANGDDIGSLRFNEKAEFVSGQSYVSKKILTGLGLFESPEQVFQVLSSSQSIRITGLIPAVLYRPIHRRLHPANSNEPQDLQIDFVLEQYLEGKTRNRLFAGLERKLLVGAHRNNPIWASEVILFKELAEPTTDIPLSFIQVDNPFPSLEFENAVMPIPIRPIKDDSKEYAVVSVYLDFADHPHDRLAIYFAGDPGAYRFEFYRETMPLPNGIAPSEDPREPAERALVGYTNPTDSQVLNVEKIIWLDSESNELFFRNLNAIASRLPIKSTIEDGDEP